MGPDSEPTRANIWRKAVYYACSLAHESVRGTMGRVANFKQAHILTL